ncbi:MAG: helix-turn-helix transcriptional regulator [Alkalinema sp. RU_4_3]|nr:helix-turn-helix transcriptional regulator [Alkalinema sp. RU_4_3]
MPTHQPLATDCADWPEFLPTSPLLASFQSGWNGAQIAHYRYSSIDLPEVANAQHIVIVPLGHESIDLELVSEGHSQAISYREKDFAGGCIEVLPADLPYGLHSTAPNQRMELIHCYLEPTFLAQVAHESVNPDRVELMLTPKTPDLLMHQIALALRSSLVDGSNGNRFYADAMATAMAAHLLRYYTTRDHVLREYKDGLSKQKLQQAIDYMQANLGEDLSLGAIAQELGMSQYYFCHLFKRSTGLSPHQYLIRQRVERAKILLKQSDRTVTMIALECGFASSSHLAKCFRQLTGLNPNQFRKL